MAPHQDSADQVHRKDAAYWPGSLWAEKREKKRILFFIQWMDYIV